MDKRIVYGLVAAAVVAAGVAAYFSFGGSGDVGSGDKLAVEIVPTDHVRGKPNAPITIVEYAAMHCPFCARFEREAVPKLIKTYVDTGKVRLVFRDFPLIGPDWLASGVTHCAQGEQYFALVDFMFLNQEKWVGHEADTDHDGQLSEAELLEGLVQMGRVAGFSREKVQSCMNDPATQASLQQVEQDAVTRYGVDSTPTFIIDGHVHKDIRSWEDMDAILKPLLVQQRS